MADDEEIVRILRELGDQWRRHNRERSIDRFEYEDFDPEAYYRARKYNRYRPRNARGYRRRNYNRKDLSYSANHSYDDYYQNRP